MNTSVVSVVELRNRVPVTTIAQTANIVDVPSDNDQRRLLGQITTALHMRRAAAVFHKQGLFPDLYPVDFQSSSGGITILSLCPSARALDMMTAVIHELVGFATYRIQGYI